MRNQYGKNNPFYKHGKYCNISKEEKNILSSLHMKEYYKKYPWKRILSYIKTRCTNKNRKTWKNYGGRGIKCLITSEELKKL